MSDIPVSPLTLGTVQLGMPYGIANRCGMPDEETSFNILNAAVSLGITCLDTAAGYGQAETVIGSYFMNRAKPTIVTKLTPDIPSDLTDKELERAVIGSVEQSLDRLRCGKVDIIMLHRPSHLLAYGGSMLNACNRLVRDGYAGKIGISYGADPVASFHEVWPWARNDLFEAVQIPLNALDNRLIRGGALTLLEESGKLVFARSVFLQGLLQMSPEELPHTLRDAAGPLAGVRTLAEREGITPGELALVYVRDIPQVHSLVIGAEHPRQVEENIRMLRTPPLSEETRRKIHALASGVPELVVSPHLWNRS